MTRNNDTDPVLQTLSNLGVSEAPTEHSALTDEPVALPAPANRRHSWWLPLGGVLAAAAAAVLVISLPDAGDGTQDHPGAMTARGVETPGLKDVSLFMSAQRGKRVWRVDSNEALMVGDIVFFRTSAVGEGTLKLTVEGPAGHVDISELPATAELTNASAADELVAWAFDVSGRYRFCASDAEVALTQSCVQLTVDDAGDTRSVAAGPQVPAGIQARDLSGKPFTLEKATALGPAVFVFWSSDCTTCGRDLKKVQDTVAAYPGAQIVFVSGDPAAQGSRIRGFMASNGLKGTAIHDADGSLRRELGVDALPGTLVVSPALKVLARVNTLTADNVEVVRLALDKVLDPGVQVAGAT